MSLSGSQGEKLAASFLRRNGYRILELNYRCSHGEIDIVAEHGQILCFIEVKSRSSDAFGSPFEAVTPGKQRQIFRVALHYLQKHKRMNDFCRFDVVAVFPGGKIEILADAFRG